MSILSVLPTLTAPVSIKDERGEHHPVTNAIKWVKRDDVAEALRHPTDEQVEAIALAVWDKALGVGVEEVRAVLAAAAGGDE